MWLPSHCKLRTLNQEGIEEPEPEVIQVIELETNRKTGSEYCFFCSLSTCDIGQGFRRWHRTGRSLGELGGATGELGGASEDWEEPRRSGRSLRGLHWFSVAAVREYNKLGVESNRNWFPHSLEGQDFKSNRWIGGQALTVVWHSSLTSGSLRHSWVLIAILLVTLRSLCLPLCSNPPPPPLKTTITLDEGLPK